MRTGTVQRLSKKENPPKRNVQGAMPNSPMDRQTSKTRDLIFEKVMEYQEIPEYYSIKFYEKWRWII
ncbi:MAG: hypothetical protein ACJAU6_000785 [Alphaproteobacteria bacterium]|jgi:hypothetical protein